MRYDISMTNTQLQKQVLDFRIALGKTQFQFAILLNAGIATVHRYERTRSPKGKVLVQLRKLALKTNLPTHAAIFQKAFEDEFGVQIV
jgi:transcriptional regulator with XRE-family HTH domain